MYAQMCSLVTRGGFDFAEALTYFTSNVAKALEIEKKKAISLQALMQISC